MAAPKKYPVEVRDRAIRLVQDLISDEDLQLSVTGACTRVGQQLGINRDTLRGWVKQAQIDTGQRPGLGTDERRRLRELEAENRELRRANAPVRRIREVHGVARRDGVGDRLDVLVGGVRPVAGVAELVDGALYPVLVVVAVRGGPAVRVGNGGLAARLGGAAPARRPAS